MYTAIKITLSALIVVAVSEIAKRSTFLGAVIASLPLTSLLALSWLYYETNDAEKVASLSAEILWLVVPSLTFFALLPILLRIKLGFALSMGGALSAMLIAYLCTIVFRRTFMQ